MAKKRLLFVVEAMGGGVFTYIVDLANELSREFDVYIAYSVRPQTPKDYERYFNSSIHLIKVDNFTRSINPLKDLKAIFEVKRIAKSINPDIIHLHSSKAGVIGRIAFNGNHTPVYYTPHGYSFLMANYKPFKRLFFKSIESIMAKRKCTTISCSYGEHQETLKINKRAKYISNGININELENMIKNVVQKDHRFTVYTLGRICYQKNPVLFNEIAEAMPDVKFIWIGDGELRNELKSSNIEITGWIDRKKALSVSMNADVFMLTSLWEGLPMSLLESMYMRKLCIVNDVIGNHDVIHNGINGYVCKNLDEFKKALQNSNNVELTNHLTEAAFNDVINYYNTNVMANEYIKIYES